MGLGSVRVLEGSISGTDTWRFWSRAAVTAEIGGFRVDLDLRGSEKETFMAASIRRIKTKLKLFVADQ